MTTWWDRNIETVKQTGMTVLVIVFMFSVIVIAVWAISGFDLKGGASVLREDLPEGCVSVYDGFIIPNPQVSGVQLFNLAEKNIAINDVNYITKEDGIYVALRYVDGYTAVARIIGICLVDEEEIVIIFSEIQMIEPLDSSS